jgi:hypothetical protein
MLFLQERESYLVYHYGKNDLLNLNINVQYKQINGGKMKTQIQKLWLDHKVTIAAVVVGIVIGAIIF